MPAITPKARVKASRIRKKGDKATAEERHFLQRFDAEKEKLKTTRKARSTEQPLTPAPAPAMAPAPAVSDGGAPLEPKGEQQAPSLLDFSGPANEAPKTDTKPTCNIPDCPACKQQRGALICQATNKKVWPPMSEAGAKALAGFLFFIVGRVIAFFRPDKRYVVPSDAERDQFAAALREVALRRASWIGAFDDLMAAVFALTRYGSRALNAPQEHTQPPIPEPMSAAA